MHARTRPASAALFCATQKSSGCYIWMGFITIGKLLVPSFCEAASGNAMFIKLFIYILFSHFVPGWLNLSVCATHIGNYRTMLNVQISRSRAHSNKFCIFLFFVCSLRTSSRREGAEMQRNSSSEEITIVTVATWRELTIHTNKQKKIKNSKNNIENQRRCRMRSAALKSHWNCKIKLCRCHKNTYIGWQISFTAHTTNSHSLY